jgi:hypothetical protein
MTVRFSIFKLTSYRLTRQHGCFCLDGGRAWHRIKTPGVQGLTLQQAPGGLAQGREETQALKTPVGVFRTGGIKPAAPSQHRGEKMLVEFNGFECKGIHGMK